MDTLSNPFPVSHSLLSPAALLSDFVRDYEIGTPIACHLLFLGLNDTYVLQTSNGQYILRVYRSRWRSLPDVLYELDILKHLNQKGISVAVPLVRRDGSFTRELRALEGKRVAVLFPYVEGVPIDLDEVHSYHFAGALAEIHNALDDFSSHYPRFQLDEDHLIDKPLQSFLPYLAHRREDTKYLLHLADLLKERLADIPKECLTSGICHGDVHIENARISCNHHVTIFDFDCCGPGWTAYDIASFRWYAAQHQRDWQTWEPFLKGYTERRELSDADREAIPLFVAIRDIWHKGLYMDNGDDLSFGALLDDQFFDQMLAFSKKWATEHLEWKE